MSAQFKKCIVLDLDNTLWGGVVGEDGMEGIALSLTSPGNSFVAFQQALLDHYDRGIILALNSRNNPEDALLVIRSHPNMLLRENHFAAMRINWNDKTENLKELAQELNIGLDSMVFLDDDVTNRELVRGLLPQVETPDLPTDPREYASFLHSLSYFDKGTTTDEDKMRGNLYVTERLRKEEEKQFENKEDFLSSLSLKLFVYEDDDSNLARLSQLTEKTNQFNTVKQPMTEKELGGYIKSESHKIFHARLQDKFGDHGIIAFALISTKDGIWNIESMLMSCRVFGRGVEHAFFGIILGRAIEEGAKKITISFKQTEKNIPAKEFISLNFIDETYDTLKPYDLPRWIRITHENI